MHIQKLTLKQRCEIKPNASVELPVNEYVGIPYHSYGDFYLRKSLAKQGLIAPHLVFHPNFSSDKVSILISNLGVNTVELNQDDELGELWVKES